MMFGDTTRTGLPYSKYPHVVELQGKYLMYYFIRPTVMSEKMPFAMLKIMN